MVVAVHGKAKTKLAEVVGANSSERWLPGFLDGRKGN
jgi:hypothetical protein